MTHIVTSNISHTYNHCLCSKCKYNTYYTKIMIVSAINILQPNFLCERLSFTVSHSVYTALQDRRTAVPNVPKITIYENLMVLEIFFFQPQDFIYEYSAPKQTHTHTNAHMPTRCWVCIFEQVKKMKIYDFNARAKLRINGKYQVLEGKHTH